MMQRTDLVEMMREQSRLYAKAADALAGAKPKQRRKLSSAARKKIATAQKRRWAVINGGARKKAA